jgi:hypothetical protein
MEASGQLRAAATLLLENVGPKASMDVVVKGRSPVPPNQETEFLHPVHI